jgi:hypothetical protein
MHFMETGKKTNLTTLPSDLSTFIIVTGGISRAKHDRFLLPHQII